MFVLHSLALLVAFTIVIKMEMALICNKEKKWIAKSWRIGECVLTINNCLRINNALGNMNCSHSPH